MNYFYQLLIGLASGAFAAWLATFLALRRFYSEKWWEKKSASFLELIDGVYHIKTLLEYYSELREYRREPPEENPFFTELNEEQLQKLQAAYYSGKILIKRYYQIAPLLASKNASVLLGDYLKAERDADFDVHYRGLEPEEAESHLLELTEELLRNLIEESRKELKLTKK